jgi:serine/threonine protein kinase/Tol biopolymer transport system component
MALTPGTIINNRYHILSVLGQGGMGYVYQAEDTVLKVYVAVKENLFLSEEYSRQFEREAQILAGLRHGFLPHVIDFFTIPGQGQYLIMNYIEGEDLRERIERLGIVPVDDVLRIGIAMCDALNYLHTRKESILHRDIKPGNIKITPEGQLVLVDFGLAKIMRGNQATTDGARAMTPGYSPPEQYGTARTDPRTDIYSLGATLYAALTGIIPEDGLDRATGKSQLTPVRQIRPDLSPQIASMIEKSLAIDPEKRFQTAYEFQQALMKAGNVPNLLVEGLRIDPPPAANPDEPASVPQPAGPPSSGVRSAQSAHLAVKPKKSIALLWTVLAVAVLAGTIYLLRPGFSALFSPSAPGQVIDTPANTAGATGRATITQTKASLPSQTPAVTAITPSIPAPATERATQPAAAPSAVPQKATASPGSAATPTGGGLSQFAFVSNRTGSNQVWMMALDGSQQQQLTNMPEGACQPDWSPDGMKLAFISPCKTHNNELYEGAGIYIIDLNDSALEPEILPARSTEGDFDPAWSPDGQRIAFTSVRTGTAHVFIYNFETETLEELSDTRYADIHPAWNPMGTQLTVSRKIIYSHIFIMSDKGYTQYQLSPNGNVEDYWSNWSPDGKSVLFTRYTQDPAIPFLVSMLEADHDTGIEARIPPLGQGSKYPMAAAVYSQDGRWILFESWPDGRNHDIFMMTVEGEEITRLTTDPGLDFEPAWRGIPAD